MNDESYRVSQATARPKTEVFSPLRPLRHFVAEVMNEGPLPVEDVFDGNIGCMFWFVSGVIGIGGFFAAGFTSDGVNYTIGHQTLNSVACAEWGGAIGLLVPAGMLLAHRYLRSVMHFDDDEVREWWLAKIRGS